ncbi:LysR family transcriptional regulator [Phyllobacterium calauticae]|jgi:DNA-binding transcriptional LysR family regulator|uniref:LysR family transcriptional regulator n=1 Tax=Phyllobacterium calauticae TaxID=2817027 RepID=UPI001CBA8A54|nr:LysR family transcriptional regulator [Phyllobacterium calauticae]MBZ3695234.1 LysR family transcriptional regulator [Phyllobacterium calauticae]
MDLNAVQMFVMVVRTGSLTAAAERLQIPLPTLSRRIRELERELKVQLLERSVRGAKLTASGMRLYEHAGRSIEVLGESMEAVMGDQAQLRGLLRLSLPPSFKPWWDLLAAFQKKYPDIRLHIYSTDRRVDLVEDGVDVALRVGAIAHEAMVARKVIAYRHVVVASQALLEEFGIPSTPAELHRFPCAIWSQDGHSNRTWRLGNDTFEHSALLSTNDYAHLCERALSGDVVTELPPFLAEKYIREGRLVALLPDHLMPTQQINLLYPSHRHPSTIVRAYLEFCKNELGSVMHST